MRSACSHPWQDSNLQPHVEIHARVGVKVRRRIQRCLWDAEPTGQAGGPFASQDGRSLVHSPLDQVLSTRWPSRRMPTRSSTAAEPMLRSSQVALTDACLAR